MRKLVCPAMGSSLRSSPAILIIPANSLTVVTARIVSGGAAPVYVRRAQRQEGSGRWM